MRSALVMTFEDIFLGLLVALASGALIGIEREQSAAHENKPRLGGIRTFPLLALAGALSALLAHTLGVWPILGALLVGVAEQVHRGAQQEGQVEPRV